MTDKTREGFNAHCARENARDMAPKIGAHMATLNLFREADGTYRITVAEARGFIDGPLKDVTAPRAAPIYYVEGAIIEAGAVIGAGAEIGSGTVIAPTAVIGKQCRIGRDGFVGPGASVQFALIGDRCVIHGGARIGQDGFGFVPGAKGPERIPQIGRVIIQDDVEIGANTTVDRGAMADTVIGEGTKVDNLVQIAHNVRIGRGCIIAGHCGLSGSSVLGDFVMLGGSVGLADHITIGTGAQIAAGSGLMDDVPPGQRWAGLPAVPIRDHFRQVSILRSLAKKRKGGSSE